VTGYPLDEDESLHFMLTHHPTQRWYLARPILGFFVGLVCVLFIDTSLLQAGGTHPAVRTTGWRIAVAMLAGFGSQDFAERLRLLSQTVFGTGPEKTP